MLPDICGTYAGRKRHIKRNEQPCDPCRRAAARYQNLRELDVMRGRPRAVDTIGTQRRIQALVAAGWSYPALAPHFNVTPAQLAKWAKGGAFIRRDTRDRILTTYAALEMREPPTGTPAERRNTRYATTVAKRNGWLPPLAWVDIDDPDERPDMNARDDEVDEVVVLRILARDFTVTTNRAERYEVVRRWPDSDNELERLTGWNVARMRRDLNRPDQEVA